MLSSGHLGMACVGWAGAGTRRCRSGRLAGGFGLLRDAARVAVGWWAVGWWVGAGSAGEWRMQKPRDKQQPRAAHLWVVEVNVPGQRLWQQRQQTGRGVSTEHMLGCTARRRMPPLSKPGVMRVQSQNKYSSCTHCGMHGEAVQASKAAGEQPQRHRDPDRGCPPLMVPSGCMALPSPRQR